MVAHRCDRIYGALHCVCIWNRGAFLSHALTAAASRLAGVRKTTSGTKNYAVGLEISRPGGVYNWAPEIPSTGDLAGAMPGKCDLDHKPAHSFQMAGGLRPRLFGLQKLQALFDVDQCIGHCAEYRIEVFPGDMTFGVGMTAEL
jgi:hypothetical protein